MQTKITAWINMAKKNVSFFYAKQMYVFMLFITSICEVCVFLYQKHQ